SPAPLRTCSASTAGLPTWSRDCNSWRRSSSRLRLASFSTFPRTNRASHPPGPDRPPRIGSSDVVVCAEEPPRLRIGRNDRLRHARIDEDEDWIDGTASKDEAV